MYKRQISRNPFYAEGGGQIGDRGVLVGTEDGEEIKVVATIKENNLPISVREKIPSKPCLLYTSRCV